MFNYSQGFARVTEGLITRLHPVATPGYSASLYYDGVGIYPNLQTGGATFLNAFTTALTDSIQKSK